jgi:hypothetical protein
MCDYSLMMVRSRLAVEGEELVAHRFQSGTVGLVSCADFSTWINERPIGFWQRLNLRRQRLPKPRQSQDGIAMPCVSRTDRFFCWGCCRKGKG